MTTIVVDLTADDNYISEKKRKIDFSAADTNIKINKAVKTTSITTYKINCDS